MHHNISKIVLIIILNFLIIGCNLLTTRDAEDPENSRSSYVVATTPAQLFLNLRNSYLEKVEKDYISCIVDSSFLSVGYLFVPSSEAVYKYNVLLDWDTNAEGVYFRNLINAISENDNIILTLELLDATIEGESQIRNYNYTITLPFIGESTSTIYEGNALFKINLDSNNQWVITEWTDIKTGVNPTWSELKGTFYLF